MAHDRGRLHLTKLDDFAAWAKGEGFTREPTKGPYEVLRLRGASGPPLIWFRRDKGQQATTPDEVPGHPVAPSRLVSRWFRARKAARRLASNMDALHVAARGASDAR